MFGDLALLNRDVHIIIVITIVIITHLLVLAPP